MYSPEYYPIHYLIQDCIDYFNSFFDIELPEFEINDNDYEQKEPISYTEPISYYRKDEDVDDEYINIIII